ncbi:T9SS type A sorting domain-containing protein [Algibacter sp. PT7-4]
MKTSKKIIITVSFLLLLLLVEFVLFFKNANTPITSQQTEEHQEEYEEEPEENILPEEFFDPKTLNNEELAEYKKWRNTLEKTGYKFTNYNVLTSSETQFLKFDNIEETPNLYAYANNTITGSWHQKNLTLFDDSGFRADGSTYDPVNEELYVVSFAGHLYKIDENAPIKWSLRNHKKNLLGDDFNGINLPDNSFRLLHQKANGPMEFSDDEGRNWIDANGAFFQSSWNHKTLVSKTPSGRKITAHGGSYINDTAYDRLFISTDYGLNYTESSIRFKKSDFEVIISKPHSSNTIYCFARRKSDSKILIYKMSESDNDFSLLRTTTQSFSAINSIFGSHINSATHFYISSGNKLFYSNNEGLTWLQTNSNNDRPVTEVHPTQPNICYKGFVELFMSTDYGATWSKNNHYLSSYYVWDLQHMKTYDKENGDHFTFAGFDFGSFYTSNPMMWNSWTSINSGSPNIMAYDATTSETNDKIYTANQDRGSQGFIDIPNTDNIYNAAREANTDVLRVQVSNDESSVWFWYYYGTIGHASVANGGDYRTVVRKDFYSSWWATSMVPSPNINEDAIYIPAGGNKLNKYIYQNGSITQSFHPFVFPGPPISFAYSKINTNRWYVGLKNGGLMFSANGGQNFSTSNYSGPWPGQDDSHRKRRTVIATSPIDESTVYFAGKGNLFLESKDGGLNFTNKNTGLNVARITDLAVSPNGKYIFASCESDGAWVYSTENNRWYKMDGFHLPNVQFTDVQFIKSKNLVRFATYGSGILDFKINENLLSISKNKSKSPSINVVPNPTSGVFEIKTNSLAPKVNIDLYSENGTLLSKQTYKQQNGKISLDITNHSSGVYILKMHLEKSHTIKVVKN